MLDRILHEGSTKFDLLTKSQRVLFRRLLLEIRGEHIQFDADADDDCTSASESLRILQSFWDSSMEECILVIDLV